MWYSELASKQSMLRHLTRDDVPFVLEIEDAHVNANLR